MDNTESKKVYRNVNVLYSELDSLEVMESLPDEGYDFIYLDIKTLGLIQFNYSSADYAA